MVIFHSYVKLPEGIFSSSLMLSLRLAKAPPTRQGGRTYGISEVQPWQWRFPPKPGSWTWLTWLMDEVGGFKWKIIPKMGLQRCENILNATLKQTALVEKTSCSL